MGLVNYDVAEFEPFFLLIYSSLMGSEQYNITNITNIR